MADISITENTSMADIRTMLAPAAEPAEPKTEASEPVAEPKEPVAAAEPKAAAEPAEPKQEPTEEPLPEGVQKRIAKEAERAARAQAAIDRAVSDRKAKEAEAAKLTDKSGSEPVPNTASAENAKPVKPEFGAEGQTWAQYQKALAEYETKYEAWLQADTRRTVEQEFSQRKVKEAAEQRMAAAVEKHGKDFPATIQAAFKDAPEGLGIAISSLEDWSGVAAHLAKAPEKIAELSTLFATNPYAAIAKLGRIEASLKPASKPAVAAEKLPAPPAKEGGSASASAAAFDFEKADYRQVKAQLTKLRKPAA